MSKPTYRLVQADVLDFLRGQPSETFDSLLADPPYGIKMGGSRWDYDVPSVEVARELVRVLKPGAWGLFYSGTRTYHRLVSNLEDGGFEVKDMCAWVHSQGMPKGFDISKAFDKAFGAKREVVGRYQRPDGSKSRETKGGRTSTPFVAHAGEGDAMVTAPATAQAKHWEGYNVALKPAFEPLALVRKPPKRPNIEIAEDYETGFLNIDGVRVPIEEGDRVSGGAKGVSGFAGGYDGEQSHGHPKGRWPTNVVTDGSEAVAAAMPTKFFNRAAPLDESIQFLYHAKANRGERDAGLETPNDHVAVKPLGLNKHWATLLLPPPATFARTLLVPYAGTGSEVIGALMAGWDLVIGIEREPAYVEMAKRRITYWLAEEQAA